MKKNIGIVILTIIIALGAVAVLYSQHKSKVATKSTLGKVTMTEVDASKVPNDFPKDLPLEHDAKILYNFNAVNAKGENQATREFVTKYSLKINYDLYKGVLQDNGWIITTDQNPDAEKVLIATRGNNTINIHIYTDVKTLENRVSINNSLKK